MLHYYNHNHYYTGDGEKTISQFNNKDILGEAIFRNNYVYGCHYVVFFADIAVAILFPLNVDKIFHLAVKQPLLEA